MTKPISRRETLKSLGSAGAGALLNSRLISSQQPLTQDAAIQIAGRAVEISLTSISPWTLRLSITPIENGKPRPIPQDGSLTAQPWPAPAARLTSLTRERTVRCGEMRVKLSPEPLTIRIETSAGRLVQQLRPDAQTGALAFLLGDKPVLGFGEGGPQFDRRGETYTNRNGQGGYRVEKGATARNVYLPRGDWYDFWTEEKLAGGRAISKGFDLATTPLYVRAGAILPLGPVKQYTSEKVDEPMTLVVYPGADGAFTLYEDDGATFNYRRGEWTKIQIAWNNVRRTLSLRLTSGAKMPSPRQRKIEVRLAGEKTTRQAVFTGRPIEIKL